MLLAGLTTLVSQVIDPSSAVMQFVASILLSLPVALPGPRSQPSVWARADDAPHTNIVNRKEVLRSFVGVIETMSEPPLCLRRPLLGAVVSNFLQKQIKLSKRIVLGCCVVRALW